MVVNALRLIERRREVDLLNFRSPDALGPVPIPMTAGSSVGFMVIHQLHRPGQEFPSEAAKRSPA